MFHINEKVKNNNHLRLHQQIKSCLIDYRNLHPANKKINVSSDGTLIKLRDGDGRDTNSSLRIISSDVDARFSKDGRRLIYDTSKDGTIKVRFEWR